jgi:hypothetical protein
MLVPTVATFALAMWIVLWSIGVKAIDGFMLALLIIVVAAGVQVLLTYLPTQRD